ncbi:ferritin heavy chain-like [Hippopotamus amphibius kiboko]|uniref:ferritin heavy chain-like n=1 Tax=Hippopotamus amphibius kiboko TaxID=575201 RepID=UPI0025989A5B|nr:ferritin heavy chain-like [Hippopotamus amphibius kiboko]
MGMLRGRHRQRRHRCPPRTPIFRLASPTVFNLPLLPPPPPPPPPPQPSPPPAMLPPPPPPPEVRQNYHPDCEAAVNSHTNLELHASFVCLVMSFYLDQEDVALKHFPRFFLRRSDEHNERAEGLMRLQNLRGGQITFHDIRRPDTDDWESGLKAMQYTLLLEKRVNQSLLDLRQLATDKRDPQLCHFLQTHYLSRQVEFIKELGNHVTSLSKMEAPEGDMAEYLFDNLTMGNGDEN